MIFPKIEELKRMRIKSGLSQTDLAKLVNVSQSAIAKYENGSQIPSYTIATKIFQILFENVAVNEPTISDLMISEIFYLQEDDTLQMAMQKMRELSISQIPIRSKRGSIIGTINESKILDLLSQYHSLEQFRQEEIKIIMDEPLPIISGDAKITEVSQILKRYGGVLVTDFGKIVGIITKSDLLIV